MIFITTGSRSFQFNRLLKAVDDAVEQGKIKERVIAQIGNSDYKIKNFEYYEFLNQEEFAEKIKECDVVLTHGGTGVIVNALKLGKHVVAVPRLAKYGEVVDDHQIQLVEAFEKLEMVTPCYECTSDNIANAINNAKNKIVKPYVSNTHNIIESIDSLIMKDIMEVEKSDKIRILMCSSARSEKGGINSVIDQLMEHKWNDRLSFSYLATHISGNVFKKTCFFVKAYIELLNHIKKNTFDVIHIHMSYKGSFHRKYLVAKKCKKANKKVIIHLHGSEFKLFYTNGSDNLKKKVVKLFEMVDKVIVLGKEWYDFICEIAPKTNVMIINNSISIPDYKKESFNKCRKILFMGALIKRKGVLDLLKATMLVYNKGFDNFKLLIAGSGEEEKLLKQYVEENGLSRNVEFLGWISFEKKEEILKTTDLFVLPSYNEGLPIAILEAMAYGIPIISTNVGSINEAVKDGVNGFLINPGNIEQLSERIIELIANEELLHFQSKESIRIVEEKFSDKRFFELIEGEYIALMR